MPGGISPIQCARELIIHHHFMSTLSTVQINEIGPFPPKDSSQKYNSHFKCHRIRKANMISAFRADFGCCVFAASRPLVALP